MTSNSKKTREELFSDHEDVSSANKRNNSRRKRENTNNSSPAKQKAKIYEITIEDSNGEVDSDNQTHHDIEMVTFMMPETRGKIRIIPANKSTSSTDPTAPDKKTFETKLENHKKTHESPAKSSNKTKVSPKDLKLVNEKTETASNSESSPFDDENACKKCGKSFETRTKLSNHMRIHGKPIKCPHCDVKLKRQSLYGHIKTHQNQGSYPCSICSKVFANQILLSNHESTHDKKYECPRCERKFAQSHELNAHIRDVHDNPKSYECSVCSARFNTKRILWGHVRIHDPERNDVCEMLSNEKKVKPATNENSNDSDVPLSRLINSAPKDENACENCGKSFESREKLLNHLRIHKPLVKCPHCDVKLKRQSLYGHIKTHQNQGSYPCSICSKVFSNQILLSKHESTHDKKHQCFRCERKFAHSHELNAHIRNIHDNPQSYECSVCSARFDTRRMLREHKQTHESRILKYFCDKCDFNSKRKSVIINHMKKHEEVEWAIRSVMKRSKISTADDFL